MKIQGFCKATPHLHNTHFVRLTTYHRILLRVHLHWRGHDTLRHTSIACRKATNQIPSTMA